MKLHLDESQEYLIIDDCTQLEYDQLCVSYNKDVKNARFSPQYKSGTWDGKINFLKGKYLPATSYGYLSNLCKEYNFPCEIYGLEEIFDKFERGSELTFENTEESDYYASIGRMNLYDFSALSNENDEIMTHYFNTLPMCIMEVNGTRLWYSRCNRSYRDFLERTVGIEYSTNERDILETEEGVSSTFLQTVMKCGKEGGRIVIDERVNADRIVHTLIRRIAVNPVTGTSAVAVAVLTISGN